ncbi:MAG TPA: HypC/HybG/HupF family hydrogenase formation chaperone [Bacillota bacterium]|mgnify:CR=1 FL=1|nr:HypC/HybG/HupF family hydrogenase formation chaperone [Bacillota bacterium]HOK69472.1 HypC/HybG/HupF family hydrogenase formation chaperone [Bacillota bacterium]HPP86080.1 HypC/HybG/HupF family hydrogenase formation chaperone [Bacillota bacterium]
MCLAVPGKIIKIEDSDAIVDYGGVTKRASLRLVDNAAVGDLVLVHAGFVIQVLDKDEGEELQRLVDETMRML